MGDFGDFWRTGEGFTPRRQWESGYGWARDAGVVDVFFCCKSLILKHRTGWPVIRG